ncbi:KH domain-containing, RNA-binding, signal transduction-associated protein 3-like [Scaptodrosophila lebanonensis]|uniref:KH domain-containing, RNA-binding, signal transduction-associated protein 3-like n=1 Tax=Drosophila lebanonensis TaxID=7225 RepID=A0A6J2UBB1_DROLE|nr:KH domain-containing, RNA-binding, signal transduction-associated protein 3-like [Scaptodrosophila lebanonensis]
MDNKIGELLENPAPQSRFKEAAKRFLDDLEEERQRLLADFPLCASLIDEAVDRIKMTGRIPGQEVHADVYNQRPMKIIQKVFIPSKQFPTFNFVGKILGPKGNCLRNLQDETQCKIEIKGRNSMRDRNKEKGLRDSGDPRYAHLQKDLFVEISTFAPPAEGYARISRALAKLRKYIIPDHNDEVSQGQHRELYENTTNLNVPKLDPFRQQNSSNTWDKTVSNWHDVGRAEERRGGNEYSSNNNTQPVQAEGFNRPQLYPFGMKRKREAKTLLDNTNMYQ